MTTPVVSGRRGRATVGELARGVRSADKRALARTISLVESGDARAREVLKELYPLTGRAYNVGVTGPPGVGKSSLVSALVSHVRGRDQSIGVISIDPSSPFSHGAVLGDRIRLAEHFLDPGVFIRSMATRGHLGGLSAATLQAMQVLDAAGKDAIFVETVGTGQTEVDVLEAVDTVVLVLMPGSGDSVQALKAGIMEIPDVIAVNKADHPAAKTMLTDVRQVLSLDRERTWKIPVLLTEAVRAAGVTELWEAVERHRRHLEDEGLLEARRRDSLVRQVSALSSSRAASRIAQALADDPGLRDLLDLVRRREVDPLTAAQATVDQAFASEQVRPR